MRIGVIGLGFAGTQHLRGYARLEGVTTVALAGLEPGRLAELASEYAIARTYADWEPIVAAPDIDAVSVCAPNHLHAPIAIAALRAGKHVLCEKPLARTGDEAQAIHDAAVESGRVLHVAFNYRARGDSQLLASLMRDGALGRVYHVKASWMRRAGIPGSGTWFSSKEMAGGGPLIDLGVHVIDLALWLTGDPEVVSVTAAAYDELGSRGIGVSTSSRKMVTGTPFEVEDFATAFLRLADGASMTLDASWATHSSASDDFGVAIYGSDGGAEMKVCNYAWEDTVRLFRTVDGEPVTEAPPVERGQGHIAVVRDFVEAVTSGQWASHTGLDGLRRARVIDACYASAASGREVQLVTAG